MNSTNKILIGVDVLLVATVAFLFFKINNLSPATADGEVKTEQTENDGNPAKSENSVPLQQAGTVPTGKIAYVNIDRLNEESIEISELVAESKKRKASIEASVESLSAQYQQKVEEYQNSAKAGIAPPSEIQAKEREIMTIEKEAQNKQLQMDNLTMDIADKNANFQKNVHEFLVKWNAGKYDFILSYSEAVPTMLMGNTTLEITNEVISGLNKEYKERKAKKK